MNGESGLLGSEEGSGGYALGSEGPSEVTGCREGWGLKSFTELRWDKKVGPSCLAPHLD